MTDRKFQSVRCLLWLTLLLGALPASAAENEDVELLFGDDEFVSIATGSRQPLARAPAVATVITAQDIKAMGATNLDQVLESVPGLHVSPSSLRFSPIYSIRGIYSDKNPHVLVLVNGIPITQLFQGDRGAQSTLPISNIARIEVIRGPGSAVYGADAFAGVINVITHSAATLSGHEIGARSGSFDTNNAWISTGKTIGTFNVQFNLDWLSTDGDPGRIIRSDAQSAFDTTFATNASLAPGPADTRGERLDAHLDIQRENWRFHAWNWQQDDYGVGPGLAMAVDPSGSGDSNNYLVSINYDSSDYANNWHIRSDLSYMDVSSVSRQKLFPSGTVLPIGSDGNINFVTPAGLVQFTDGFIGNPEIYEQHTRFDLSGTFTGFDSHRLRLGTGAASADLQARETKNFGPGVIDGTVSPIDGTLTDVTGTANIFIQDKGRTLYYLSVQDEWSFAPDWDLTAGLRYDHYSDFGSTINPRVAVVWQTLFNLTSKVLYGRAFRPPSFQELFNENNPVALGNDKLDPETIDTVELAFNYQPTFDVQLALSVFHYRIDDLIEFIPTSSTTSTAQNIGEQSGSGLELEADWNLNPSLRLMGNYAFQHSVNEETNRKAGNAVRHQMYIRANWNFLPSWSLSPQLNIIADRDRVSGGTRASIDDYTTVDLTVRRVGVRDRWEFALVAKNVFDENAREPSPFSPAGVAIPNDFPLPGRSIFAEIRHLLQ